MPSPFKQLLAEPEIDEWGGQFDCLELLGEPRRRCTGYANIAKYIKSERVLTWKCQFGHISTLEDVDDD